MAGIHDYISSFASLALLTSFLGVSMGLKDFIGDMIKTPKVGQEPQKSYPVVATLLPPLLFAWFFPNGFVFALGFSSIFLAIIAIFLPLAMIMKKRRLAANTGAYQVRGGASMLGLVALTGMIIVVAQLAIMAGWT
ncbi:aromatic amino acid transport family protein (plasmid) [Vibrio chaetopteri]|uniref:aromatic amino acid transport family protein n=1 Tax=Vibrio chaetopteri TaxID=3016528 RepID=UPI0035D361A1